MTLVVNEIHLSDGLANTLIVAAADRRVLEPDGSYRTRRKLFDIPYLNATISYFGLADVFPKGKREPLSTWLSSFINKESRTEDLGTFVNHLRDALHEALTRAQLRAYGSGFHICGYNHQRLPDFWSLSNIGRIQGFNYTDFKARYEPPSQDFLGRDARNFGWNGENHQSVQNRVFIYRNGDLRAHVLASEVLDSALSKLFAFPDFRAPRDASQYGDYLKSKFEFIAFLYRKWAKKKIIGTPIDVMVRTSRHPEKLIWVGHSKG
jgi:hypothetical protein